MRGEDGLQAEQADVDVARDGAVGGLFICVICVLCVLRVVRCVVVVMIVGCFGGECVWV